MARITTKQKSKMATFKDKAEAIVKRIADDRDELRDLIDKYESICDDADIAIDGFRDAIGTLSQLL